MNADGSADEADRPIPLQDAWPVSSPDGQKIAFTSTRDGNDEIYSMNADGTGPARLTNNSAQDTYPDWGVEVIDSTPPETHDRLWSLGPDQRPDSPTFSFHSSEAGSTFACRFDTAAFGPCTGPGATHTPSAPALRGPPQLPVRATDPAGNTDPTPTARSFSVDIQAPGALTSPAPPRLPGEREQPQAPGQRRGGLDDSDLHHLRLLGGPVAAGTAAALATPGITFSVPDNSSTTFRATATDAAGNTSSCPAPLSYTELSVQNGKIVFSSHRDGNDEIYSMNADGSAQTRLTNNAASDYDPAFSPDAGKIAFTSRRDGNDEIYVMNTDGSGARPG